MNRPFSSSTVAALIGSLISLWSGIAAAADISPAVRAIEDRVVAWRRDIHANPELGNREFRTAALVAEHLQSLDMQVETGVAHTGVVGLLKGGRPGPTVALRADMDALPVRELVDLPFASKVTAEYNGQTVGVMHACGHDNHVAILMGVAQLLADQRAQLAGKVLFIFQPAEEGPPEGEQGGAALMLAEGLFERFSPDVVFGLHVTGNMPVGELGYREGPTMAAADEFKIFVTGKQTHASRPWQGVDPVVISAQILLGLQTIASRQVDVTLAPSIISVGSVRAGVRNNIIPDDAELWGTIRTFDMAMREQIHRAIDRMASATAEAAGGSARFELVGSSYPVTRNDPALVREMLPTMADVVGEEQVRVSPLSTGAEDFSFFANEVPGFYFRLGATPRGVDLANAPSNHSPLFEVDEGVLPIGVEVLTRMTKDYLRRRQ